MIPLLPLLALAPQAFDPSTRPAWVEALLRDAPRSLRMPPPALPRPRPGEDRHFGPDALLPDQIPAGLAPSPSAKPEPWKVLQDRADALIDGGRYEEAYRVEKAGHEDDDELFEYDRLPDAALLTGRYAEAQRLLVQRARLYGAVDDTALRLSLASAAQGRAYPGQGAWALDELRWHLTFQYGPSGVAKQFGDLARYEAPTTPAGVAALSVLALGLMDHDPAYLEWALRLDPRCVPAGSDLVDHYGYRHRPADAARVAAAMVKALPPGKDRDGFATRLKAIRGEMAKAAPAGGAKAP